MALLRKLFDRKAMEGLSHVSERVFVFNSCLSTETEALDEDAYKDYLSSTIIQLKACNPHASFMVVNFAAAPTGTDAVHSLLRHGEIAVTDYPSRYAGCPSLPLPMIRAFLGSSVDWLVSGHQRNILLMHCDGAAWPALAFAMASLLVYIEEAAPEQRTLDAVYERAPVQMLGASSALDPRSSHLRYLQYVARLRDKGSQMGIVKQERFVLDCLILRAVPDFDGGGGCRPAVRVHGQPRAPQTDASPELLFSTPRIKQQFKHYKQADSTVIKADIGCQIQGDVVIECIHVGDQDHEDIMFRVMFNTCFLQSNMMVFTLDDIDLPWNCCREKLQEDFKIEVFFSEVELSDIDKSNDDDSELGNADEFYDFDEILIDMDFHEWHGETSRQDHGQEGSETGASDSASGSSEEKGEEDEIGASDSSSNSSEEKGSIISDGESTELIHGGDVIRESKDAGLGEPSYPQEVGSSSNVPPIVLTRRNITEEMSTNCQKDTSAQEGVIPDMQQGVQGVTNNVNEYGALNPQLMRKTRQKHAAIIPPVPIIRKKIRKTETGSDDKKPAISNRVGSQKGALVATSSSKSSTSQAKTTPSPPKPYEIANRLKQGAPQARRTTPSFAPSPLGRELNQEDNKGSGSPLDKNKKPVTRPSEKPRTGKTLKQEATTSSVVQAPRRTTVLKKSVSLPTISETATIASSGESRTTNSLPGVKTSRPSSGFHIAASSPSPRAHKHGMSPPSSPGRSPLAGSKFHRAAAQPDMQQGTSAPVRLPRRASLGELSKSLATSRAMSPPSSPARSPLASSKFHRAAPTAQPDMQQGTSAPVRLPRRASFGELSKSPATSRASDGHSLSPKISRVVQNHREGMTGSARSLSPLSPRLTRTQPSTKSAAAVTMSCSKDNNRSGAAPARPTRLSS